MTGRGQSHSVSAGSGSLLLWRGEVWGVLMKQGTYRPHEGVRGVCCGFALNFHSEFRCHNSVAISGNFLEAS